MSQVTLAVSGNGRGKETDPPLELPGRTQSCLTPVALLTQKIYVINVWHFKHANFMVICYSSNGKLYSIM